MKLWGDTRRRSRTLASPTVTAHKWLLSPMEFGTTAHHPASWDIDNDDGGCGSFVSLLQSFLLTGGPAPGSQQDASTHLLELSEPLRE